MGTANLTYHSINNTQSYLPNQAEHLPLVSNEFIENLPQKDAEHSPVWRLEGKSKEKLGRPLQSSCNKATDPSQHAAVQQGRKKKKGEGREVEVALFPAYSMQTTCFQILREHRDAEHCTPGTVLLPSSLRAPTRAPSPANHRHWWSARCCCNRAGRAVPNHHVPRSSGLDCWR